MKEGGKKEKRKGRRCGRLLAQDRLQQCASEERQEERSKRHEVRVAAVGKKKKEDRNLFDVNCGESIRGREKKLNNDQVGTVVKGKEGEHLPSGFFYGTRGKKKKREGRTWRITSARNGQVEKRRGGKCARFSDMFKWPLVGMGKEKKSGHGADDQKGNKEGRNSLRILPPTLPTLRAEDLGEHLKNYKPSKAPRC